MINSKTKLIELILFFQEVKEIFEAFDKDKSGNLDFDEFLIALRVCEILYIQEQDDI